MTDPAILAQLPLWDDALLLPKQSGKTRNLRTGWDNPAHLPSCVTTSPTVMRCRELLGPLACDQFPERNLARFYGQVAIPYATLAAVGMRVTGYQAYSRLGQGEQSQSVCQRAL